MENKPVGVDSQGNVTVLFGASIDGFKGRASNRQAAKDVILARMRSEITQRGGWNGTVIHSVMAEKLPSLGKFMRDDETGDLRSEWNALKSEAESSLPLPPAVLQHRTAIAERMMPYLPPGLGVSFHDDGLSWLTHTFSQKKQQQIIDQLTSLNTEPLDSILNIDRQMLRDLNRDTYDIALTVDNATASQSADSRPFLDILDYHAELTPKAKQILRQLHAFCNGDLHMMASLSKLMNQHAISALMKADEDELRPNSGDKAHFHADSKKANSQSLYRLTRTADGEIHLLLSHTKKGSRLVSPDFQTLCQFKPGPAAEIADERHFNYRCCTEISLNEQAIKQQQFILQSLRPASVDYVLDIDWGNKVSDKV